MKQIFVIPLQTSQKFNKYCKSHNIELIKKRIRCYPGTEMPTKEKEIIQQWEKRYRALGFDETFACNIYEIEEHTYVEAELLAVVQKIFKTPISFRLLPGGLFTTRKEQ